MNEKKNNSAATRPKKPEPHYQITKAGSLGLLALGDIGLELWRAVRDEKKQTNE
jgi:hypothetical protein